MRGEGQGEPPLVLGAPTAAPAVTVPTQQGLLNPQLPPLLIPPHHLPLPPHLNQGLTLPPAHLRPPVCL